MLFNETQTPSTEQLEQNLLEIVAKLHHAPEYGFDLETTGFDSKVDRITVVSLATPEESWALETAIYPLSLIKKYLKQIFDNKDKIVVFHNANFDLKFLRKAGIYLKNRLADTMVLAWLYREDKFATALRDSNNKIVGDSGHGLKHLVSRYLGYRMATFEQANSLFGNLAGYAADDAKYTVRLYHWLKKELTAKIMAWFYDVEMPTTQIIVEMETRGVSLDLEQLKSLKKEACDKVDEISGKIHKIVGYEFDVSSAEQCAKALFEDMAIGKIDKDYNKYTVRGENEKKKVWSTADDILKAVARAQELNDKEREVAKLLLEFREINTRLNTFIRPLLDRCLEHIIIHPSFLQIGTKTGRFSSRDPNFQNLPRSGGIRKAFIARKGYKLVKVDFSQAEIRLMAHFSQDPTLLQIYRNNGDVHTLTSKICNISRQAAKAVNFGTLYRMSAKRLQMQLASEGIIFTIEQCQDFLNKYFIKYAYVRKFHNKVEKEILSRIKNNEEFSYITTLGGRLRRLERGYLLNEETGYTAVTQGINAIIQGGVGDLIKFAMVRIQKIFREKGWLDPENDVWDVCIIGQVHDELVIEAKEHLAQEAMEIVKREMEYSGTAYGITVPMTAEGKIVMNLGEK